MRALVLSDVHGNLAALEAVLAGAPPHDALWCLGDLVDYGPEPDQCVARLVGLGARCVLGNHDRLAAEGRCEDGWTDRRLGARSLAALRDLPAELSVGSVTLRHALAVGLRPPEAGDLATFQGRLLLVGHSHLPLLYRPDRADARWLEPPAGQPIALGSGRAIANPGSVGSPFGDPGRASALLYDDDARELTWLSVACPTDGVLGRLSAAGAPAALLASQRCYLAGQLAPMRQARAEHLAWAGLSSAGAAPPASGS
jgi:predicted phosphodiesterase